MAPDRTDRDAQDARPSLWICPMCGQSYVAKNMSHSCAVVPWRDHFEGRPAALQLFECLHARLEEMGSVEIFSTRSRLGFMTRVRFCGAEPRRDGLRVRLWLKRPLRSPRLRRTEHISGDDWNVWVDVTECADLDAELVGWLREARSVGDQDHLEHPAREPMDAVSGEDESERGEHDRCRGDGD